MGEPWKCGWELMEHLSSDVSGLGERGQEVTSGHINLSKKASWGHR